ncbi:MAG: DUF402 domain-containing protein [Candidatus Asgardarchaeia archaeon]
MGDVRVKIRGIYSTALTKIALDSGFRIVQPSEEIMKRFSIERDLSLADLEVYDLFNSRGVYLKIRDEEKASDFYEEILSKLPLSIPRSSELGIFSLYRGKVVKVDRNGSVYVDLGEGRIGIGKFGPCKVGQTYPFIMDNPNPGRKYPRIRRGILKDYGYFILYKPYKGEGKITIDSYIEEGRRKTLMSLSYSYVPPEISIRWLPPSYIVETKELEEELDRALKDFGKIVKEGLKEGIPKCLFEGFTYTEIEFPLESKLEMDKIRSKVTPTVKGHHMLKSGPKPLTYFVDLSEKLMKSLGDGRGDIVERTFLEVLKDMFPKRGESITIQHVKLNGDVYYLGKGKVVESNPDEGYMEIKRVIKRAGVYDGLNLPKEEGDYCITQLTSGSNFLKHIYFSKDGEVKGYYYNINTGVEIYPKIIRYLDLEVDIVKYPDGRVVVLEKELLKKKVEELALPQYLLDFTLKKKNELIEMISKGF